MSVYVIAEFPLSEQATCFCSNRVRANCAWCRILGAGPEPLGFLWRAH